MHSRPRILILTTSYLPLIGGSELAIFQTTKRLGQFNFDMVTGRYTQEMAAVEQMGHLRVFRAGGRLSRLTMFLPKNLMPIAMVVTAMRLMRTHRYTVVHAYQASQAGGAAWLLKLFYPRVPLILTLQEGKDLDRQSFLLRFFRGMIIRSADSITAISAHLRDYARTYTNTPITIVSNGVVLREVTHVPRNPDPTILTVSRLVTKNNIGNLIRALPIVRSTVTNARLVIVGDGSLRTELENVGSQLGVRDAVHFMGTVPHDQLVPIYAMADVFVRPSLSEGLGNVFLEAMAAGVPVVASRVGGIADFLTHEQTGLVCDEYSPEDIAAQIVRVFTDVSLRENMVSRALSMVRGKYDWEIISRQMGEVYKDVLDKTK